MRTNSILLISVLALGAAGCTEVAEYPAQIQLTPETLTLEEATYDSVPPFETIRVENIGGSTIFITPTQPDGVNADLLNVGVAPFTPLLPGQEILIELSMEERTWRWETGSFNATMKIEASYFFSGQPIDEPENPSLTKAPKRVANIYGLEVAFSMNCDLDDDGFDATECAGPDCDDRDADVNPDGVESCDGVDEDCDGAIDEAAIDQEPWWLDADEDGYGDPDERVLSCDRPNQDYIDNGEDCDDSQLVVRPLAQELCDGQDNNCDGDIDEGCD